MSTAADYADLAERFGTPLYVYDLDRVRAARRSLFGDLPDGFHLYYALKANPHPAIARALREGAGPACRAEISSPGELAAALEAGYAGADCLYTGPGKTDAEIALALSHGVRRFSVESIGDLRRIGVHARAAGVVADCLLRVNALASGAATGLRMMGKPSQFGIDAETLPGLAAELSSVDGTRIAGAHFFTMSNAASEDALLAEYDQAAQSAARLAELGFALDYLDLGGGFGAPYATPGERSAYPGLRGGLAAVLDDRLPGWRTGSPELACESGRSLVAGAGRLLCRVVNVKTSRDNTFVILDGGINVLGGLSGIGRLLPAAVQLDEAGPTETAHLAGPLCTPGDLLGRAVRVPKLTAGDLVTIPNTGAYGPTASLVHFLSRPAPAEVVLDGGEVVSATRLESRRTPVGAA